MFILKFLIYFLRKTEVLYTCLISRSAYSLYPQLPTMVRSNRSRENISENKTNWVNRMYNKILWWFWSLLLLLRLFFLPHYKNSFSPMKMYCPAHKVLFWDSLWLYWIANTKHKGWMIFPWPDFPSGHLCVIENRNNCISRAKN